MTKCPADRVLGNLHMVAVTSETGLLQTCFLVTPNRSLSSRQLWYVFLVTAFVCLGLATGFAILGFWIVLPFAGLEVLALGAVFYATNNSLSRLEVIRMDLESVCIEKGRYSAEERYEYNTAWAKVFLDSPSHPGYPSRLTLGSHGKNIEVGAFLVEDDRLSLHRQLSRALNELRNSHH